MSQSLQTAKISLMTMYKKDKWFIANINDKELNVKGKILLKSKKKKLYGVAPLLPDPQPNSFTTLCLFVSHDI